jgi:hypothetical protein
MDLSKGECLEALVNAQALLFLLEKEDLNHISVREVKRLIKSAILRLEAIKSHIGNCEYDSKKKTE